MDLLNIITVTKDDFNGIKATIKSTKLLRDYSCVKQIIVDSSSTEKTKDKISLLVESNKNVEYNWQKATGIASAFNFGLNSVNAEWVWFLNGGDKVHNDIDHEKIIYLLKQSNADAIIFQLQHMNSGKIIEHPPMWAMWPPVTPWIPHPATITRNQLYKDFGNFDESFDIAMDYEFWIRCFSKRVVVDTLSIPLTQFDTNGLSNTQEDHVFREGRNIIKTYFWLLLKMWLYSGIRIVLTLKKFILTSRK